MTDGAVGNTTEIVKKIRENAKPNLRVNTFGLGSGVSTDLIKNCAKAGFGMFYFINRADEIEKYVIDALCVTFLPYLVISDLQFLDD